MVKNRETGVLVIIAQKNGPVTRENPWKEKNGVPPRSMRAQCGNTRYCRTVHALATATGCKKRTAIQAVRFLWMDQPLTPPAVRPLVRFFSMDMNRITTGTMAKMEAANRYCHSIML